MTSHSKSKFTPKLRFPEFRDEPGWSFIALGDVAYITTEKVGNSVCIPMSITSGIGLVSQESKFGRTIAGNQYKNYIKIKINDFAYNKSATKEFPQGFLARYSGDEPAAVPNSVFTCFRLTNNSLNPQYLDYLFSANLHGKWLKKFIAVGARAHGSLAIDDSVILSIPIPWPEGKASVREQQRIAECLNSLDELIGTENQKLDALKAHKKGLMQQLFPGEGEAVPRLRFPEFHNAGKWEVKAIGDVFKVTRGEVLSMTLVKEWRSNDAPYPVYSSQTKNKGLAGYFSDYLYHDAITWTTDGANAGDVNFRPGKFYCTNVCGVLLNTGGHANPCIAALLNSVSRGHVSYVGNPKLMNGVMAKIEIPFPPLGEQQRIADCLTNLDDLIAAQTQTLETLKIKKKALMQQLFPSLEELEA